jgi:membrane-associated protein
MNNMIFGLIATVFHFNTLIPQLMQTHGLLVYVVLFLLVFAETGLVVLPFLPGDSLLFLAGSLATGLTAGLNIWVLLGILVTAAVLGDFLNFELGKHFGKFALRNKRLSKIIKPKYVEQSEKFFTKHGNFAIVMGRFTPIIRTVIPFTAGLGKMNYPTFAKFNAIGGVVWVIVGLGGGYLFGSIPFVQGHFELIMLGIVMISVLPMLFTYLKSRHTPSVA